VSLGALIKYVENVVDGDARYKPQHFGVGHNEHGIELTTISQVMEKKLQECYAEVENLLLDKSPRSLMAAVDILIELEINRRGDKKKIDDYFENIQTGFEGWEDHVCGWWSANIFKIHRETKTIGINSNEIKKSFGYEVLNRVLVNFELMDIRQLDTRTRAFLTQIIEVILEDGGNQSVQSVVKLIKLLDRDRGEAPSIASPTLRPSRLA